MKTIITVLLLIGISFSAVSQGKKQMEEIKIKTSSVCGMCKHNLEKAMAFEKGVKTASLDVSTQILIVTFSPAKTSPEKIRKAVTQTGYDADDMPAEPKAYERLHSCCKKDQGIH
jgi:periplasmic mercuric ion binding protein